MKAIYPRLLIMSEKIILANLRGIVLATALTSNKQKGEILDWLDRIEEEREDLYVQN